MLGFPTVSQIFNHLLYPGTELLDFYDRCHKFLSQ
jgi:hypothetical protein